MNALEIATKETAGANCVPVRDRRGKKPVGKPRSSQGNQRKRGETVEDETRNAHDGQVGQNCGGSYQTDSNLGALG